MDLDQTKSDSIKKKIPADNEDGANGVIVTNGEYANMQRSHRTPRCYLYCVKNCPKSLKFIIQSYRLIGFSFSGIAFTKDDDPDAIISGDDATIAIIVPRLTLSAIVSLAANIALTIIAFYWLVSGVIKAASMMDQATMEQRDSATNNTTETGGETQNYETEYYRHIQRLKPILRYLINSIRYLLVFDFALNLAWCALIGGRMIRHLICVLDARRFDRSARFGVTCIAQCGATLIATFAVAIVAYNRAEMVQLFRILMATGGGNSSSNSSSSGIDPIEREQLSQFCVAIAANFLDFLWATNIGILFCYSMHVTAAAIREIGDTKRIEGKCNTTTTATLEAVKDEMTQLSGKFAQLMRWFAIPLTVGLCTDVLTVIATACVLLLTNQVSFHNFAIHTLMLVGVIFSLARLLVICVVGGWPAAAARDTVQSIFESIDRWQLDSHLVFDDVIRISESFAPTMLGGTYAVRQTTILAALGFALNYIVVLLQTENYGSSGGGGAVDSGNISSISNNTI